MLATSALLGTATTEADEYSTFPSLDDPDPVLENGVTASVVMDWLSQGDTVTPKTTAQAHPNTLVQFRDPRSGAIEWRIGTVPEGTRYHVKSNRGFDGDEVPATRGNTIAQDAPLGE
jgi:hypothetical protein